MSSKREEKAAFKKLKEAFPDYIVSLNSEYFSRHRDNPDYYCTVSGIGSTCGDYSTTANEAVEKIIKRRG